MTSAPLAVVFDLDGTLVHSVPDLRRCLNAVLAEAGRDGSLTDAQVALMVGDGVPKLVERGFAATGDALDDAARRPHLEKFLKLYTGPMPDTHPWPGALEALEAVKAKGWPMGICTNKPYAPAMELLTQLGMADYFVCVIGGDSTPQKKPDPAPLVACLDGMGVRDGKAVMVGDSPNDMEVAKNAGIPTIALSFGYTKGVAPEDLGGDVLIDSFADLIRRSRNSPDGPGGNRSAPAGIKG